MFVHFTSVIEAIDNYGVAQQRLHLFYPLHLKTVTTPSPLFGVDLLIQIQNKRSKQRTTRNIFQSHHQPLGLLPTLPWAFTSFVFSPINRGLLKILSGTHHYS